MFYAFALSAFTDLKRLEMYSNVYTCRHPTRRRKSKSYFEDGEAQSNVDIGFLSLDTFLVGHYGNSMFAKVSPNGRCTRSKFFFFFRNVLVI